MFLDDKACDVVCLHGADFHRQCELAAQFLFHRGEDFICRAFHPHIHAAHGVGIAELLVLPLGVDALPDLVDLHFPGVFILRGCLVQLKRIPPGNIKSLCLIIDFAGDKAHRQHQRAVHGFRAALIGEVLP